jgi:hypothetical protein
MSTPPPKRPVNVGFAIVLVIGAVVLLGIIGNSTKSTTGPQSQLASPTVNEPIDAAPPAQNGPATTIGEGTYVIGTDIVAGTYKSSGPSGSGIGSCYWARLTDTTGNSGTIIALDISKGPSTVTISRSDGAFKTDGCKTWYKVR